MSDTTAPSSSASLPSTMKAMVISKVPCTVSADGSATKPLDFVEDFPTPTDLQPDEILIRVTCCGVCHTELDEIEGRTPPKLLPMIPGHEVIGRVVQLGSEVEQHPLNSRVGVGWIHHSDGSKTENLSPDFCASGRDVHGGYAQYMVCKANYVYPIPDILTSQEAAPLLCAGAVGYRALKLTGLLLNSNNNSCKDTLRLGLTGFGGSGHIVLQVAKHLLPNLQVYVFCRSAAVQQFARDLGADWAGFTEDPPPALLDAVIDTTPAWKPIVAALRVLKPGGRLVINAIRKESKDQHVMAQEMDYAEHLWMEKEVKTVANVTGDDIREFLQIAGEIPLKPSVTTFPLDRANEALAALKGGHIRGAYVLTMIDDETGGQV